MPRMRCKVQLTALEHAYNNGVSVKFTPVNSGSEENKKFHAATPGGSFTATISDAASKALGAFTLSKEYYVDFTPVDEQANQS